ESTRLRQNAKSEKAISCPFTRSSIDVHRWKWVSPSGTAIYEFWVHGTSDHGNDNSNISRWKQFSLAIDQITETSENSFTAREFECKCKCKCGNWSRWIQDQDNEGQESIRCFGM